VLTVIQASIPSPTGLIAWWPGDGNANDIQGTNNGTLHNGTSFIAGLVGQSFTFNGLTNTVSVAAIPAAVNNNFTMQLWVKPLASRAATAEAISGITGTTGQRYAIFPRHGASTFGAGHAGAGISIGTNGVSVFEHTDNYLGSPLVFGTAITGWTHVAIVYTNKQPRLYLNGVLKHTGLTSTNIVHPSGDMGGPYGYFSGAVDEVGIYNRPLTAAEILSIYNAGSGGLSKGSEFTGITRMPTGKFQLGITGKTGGKFRIDASTNLVNWSQLMMLTNTSGTITFGDSTTNQAHWYYRAVLIP
jgi:hypothetical protein